MSSFRAPQTRRPTLPPPLPISAAPAASRAVPPSLLSSLPGGIISPRAASNPSDSPPSASYQPFASPSSSPLDSYTAPKRAPSPLELEPRRSLAPSASKSFKSFDLSGDRGRLLLCCVIIVLLLIILIIVASLAASGKLRHTASTAAAGDDGLNAAGGESSVGGSSGSSSGASTTVTVSATAETLTVASAATTLPSVTSSSPKAYSSSSNAHTATHAASTAAAGAGTSASASTVPVVATVPSLTETWSLSPSCPAVLGQNDAARPANSPCWNLEWFSLFAAKLQSSSLLQGTPAMQGNWSAYISGLVQDWIAEHEYWGACDDNPMIYPLQQAEGAEAAQQPQAGGQQSLLIYASAASGSDVTGTGTIAAPFQSLQRALAFSRTRALGTPAAIILRAGDYYFSEPLLINQQVDSGLSIMAQPSELVTFWGGQPFTPSWSWTRIAATNATVLVTPIPSSINTSWSAFNELMVNGSRQVRARFPNGDSFVNVMCDSSWSVDGVVWASLASFPAPTSEVTGNVRDNYAFNFYQMGFNGSAAPYLNQQNYWSQLNPSAGSYRGQYSSFTYTPSQFSPRVAQWTQVESSIIHAPHVSGWGSWQLQLSIVDTATSTVNISGGGFQESRGANAVNQGVSCLFIDHQLAELDTGGEFYIDAAARLLYWLPNSSEAATPTELLPSQVMTMLWISGGLQSVAVQGITFTHTANSFMAPHMASGGGDWANTVEAAVRITDCANCSVTYCLFTQLGGNGVVVEQSSNGSLIAYNEFSYLGANAVAVMGVMLSFNATVEWTQPRDSRIVSNLMHDVGKYNKQSGGVYNTLAYRSVVQGNVIATTPRSGVNFNDGFAGGHVFAYNLMINTAMETEDVGPFNSWNRNPYFFISSVTGQGSWNTDTSYNHHNLIMVDNQSPGIDAAAFDHDDGSTAFVNYENVLVNSRTKLYLGTNITYDTNLLLPLSGMSCWWFPTLGPRSRYENNLCMQLGVANLGEHAGFVYDLWANGCSESGLLQDFPSTFNNSYYLTSSYNTSQPAVSCNGAEYSLAAFQEFNTSYAEPGSSVQPLLPQYPYYRYVGTGLLGVSSYACFNNSLNSQYSSAMARAHYVMPLQQNLTEITTGGVGMAETTAGGLAVGVATFTNSTSRGGAWTGQGYSLFLLPTVIGFLGTSYSQTFWAMTTPSSSYPTVFVSGAVVSTTTSFFTQLSESPTAALGFSHGASGQLLCTYELPASLSAGHTWYHVGVTFNSSTLVASLYLNGQLVNQTANNPVWLGGSRIQAGYLSYRSYPYVGLMQWLSWANYEMTSAQVAEAYTSTLAL